MNFHELPHPTGSRNALRVLFVLVAALAAILLVRPDASAAAGFELKIGGEHATPAGGSVSLDVDGARGARGVALYVDGALRRRDRSWPWSFGRKGWIQVPAGEHQVAVQARFRNGTKVRRTAVVVPLRRDAAKRRSDIDDNRMLPTKGRPEEDKTEKLGPGLLWAGDFETGSVSQWPIVQRVASDRIQIAQDPTRQGNYAARFEVRPGDNIGNTAPRAELAAELHEQEGDERYYRWFTLFDQSFPTEFENSFVTFTQWRSTNESGAYTSFMVWGDEIELRCDGTRWEAPLVKGVWHEFIYHVKWSADPNVGFIELWYDGQLVMPKVYVETMDGAPGSGVENYVKQGLYKSDEIPTGVVYHDGFVSGTSLAAVQGAS
jgi:hypothetical protein